MKSVSTGTVAVVGSGIVGTTVAWQLVQKGYTVDVFEKGPAYPYPHGAQFQEEIVNFRANPAYRMPRDLKHLVMSGDYRGNLGGDLYMVEGGSATRWSALTLRMIAGDFQTRSRYGYGTDWPLSYDELEPYYCKAEQLLGVSGTDADNPFAPPRSRPFPLPPFELGHEDAAFAGQLRAAGIVLHTTPQARARHDYDERSGCRNFGTCHVCPIGARYSPNHHLQRALRTGRCRLHTGVSVRRIVVDNAGRATGLVVQRNDERTGVEHHAQVVVVAASTIESARLLMLSATAAHPDGLGNHAGHLGRHLTFHHGWHGEIRYAKPVYPGRFGGYTGQSYQFLDAPTRGRHGAVKLEFPFGEAVDDLLKEPPKSVTTPAEVVERLRERVHWQPVRLHSEASAGKEKYVTLADEVDRFGDRFAHVHYRLGDFDHATYAFARGIFERVAAATGAGEARFGAVNDFTSAAHHHGTCRMGRDPADGVTDPFGRVHGIPNLFVAGGSTFVGSAAVNPTLTMVALAMRSADFMIDQVL